MGLGWVCELLNSIPHFIGAEGEGYLSFNIDDYIFLIFYIAETVPFALSQKSLEFLIWLVECSFLSYLLVKREYFYRQDSNLK